MPVDPEEQNPAGNIAAVEDEQGERFPELAEMQREISKRIADNRLFLERFLDEDFPDEGEGEEEDSDDDFEEL